MDRCKIKEGGLELRDVCRSCGGAPRVGQLSLLRGCVLYLEGTRGAAIFAVVDGYVFETRTLEDGRTVGIRLAGPGDLLGSEAIASEPYQCTAEAITPARVCSIPVEEIGKRVASRPDQGMLLCQAISREAIGLRDGLLSLGSMSAEERVRAVLVRLTRDATRGEWTELPLSRTELAELLGLAVGTVSRTIQRFVREGSYQVSGRRIRVL